MKSLFLFVALCLSIPQAARAEIWYEFDTPTRGWLFFAQEVSPDLQEKLGRWDPLALYSFESAAVYISVISAQRKDNNLTVEVAVKDAVSSRHSNIYLYYNKGPDANVEAFVKIVNGTLNIILDPKSKRETRITIRAADSLDELKRTTKLYVGAPFWDWESAGVKL